MLIRNRTHLIDLVFLTFLFGIGLTNCGSKNQSKKPKVFVKQTGNKYAIYRNGKPFEVKGAGGDSHFKMLADCGGNTLRIWDTTHLDAILDSAVKNNLAVIVGLPIPSDDKVNSFYSNPENVKNQLASYTALIQKHKSDPAILMWCLGNELPFRYTFSAIDFYAAFNDLTDMIHRVDPDHPVTTTILNFNIKHITNLKLLCDIDVISFNIFGDLPQLRNDLKKSSWLWDGPFMILEWGVNGPWYGTEKTAWSSYIEDASWKKAAIYKERYLRYVPTDDDRFLGACVFFWGNKQEYTQTWFSLFDEQGEASETVGVMKTLWTGSEQNLDYPKLRFMLVNQKGARDNIITDPGVVLNAELVVSGTADEIGKIKWELYQEDWYTENNIRKNRKLTPLKTLLRTGGDLKTSLVTPTQEGPYRLFGTAYNANGTYASCNTPFYVVNAE